MKTFELPPLEDVLFVHYHCDEFGKGDKIYKLTAVKGDDNIIHCWGISEENSEIKAIKDYSDFITKNNGRNTVVSWNQTFLNYGPAHINERYYKLTGKKMNLTYKPHIELSNYLWSKYGHNYIQHPRLDNLARKNNFLGSRSRNYSDKSYITQRLMLIVKIYGCELKGELKVNSTSVMRSEKSLKDLLITKNSNLYKNLIKDYKGKRGKAIAVMIIALKELGLIAYDTRKELLGAIRNDFGPIGTDESINKYLRFAFSQHDHKTQYQIKKNIDLLKGF